MGKITAAAARWITGPTEAEISAAAPPGLRSYVPVAGGVAPTLYAWAAAGRSDALALPAVSRARDLICGFVATVPFRAYTTTWTAAGPVDEPTPAPAWCTRPDPGKPRAFTLAGTVDDLMFHARAYWWIIARDALGGPTAFRWVPIEELQQTADQTALVWRVGIRSGYWPGYGTEQPTYRLPVADVVEFTSPFAPILEHGSASLATATALEAAAKRFATVEMPSGWLSQTGGEPLSGPELQAVAAEFAALRAQNAIAALNPFFTWNESTFDPERLQLTEARNYQAREAGRLCNVPAALLDAEVSSMTYSNQRDQLSALWWFGCHPLGTAIGEVLSGGNVTPPGITIRLDPTGIIGPPEFAAPTRPAEVPQ